MKNYICAFLALGVAAAVSAQDAGQISSITFAGRSNDAAARALVDGNLKTGWVLSPDAEESAMLTLAEPGTVESLTIAADGLSADRLAQLLKIYITYDPMNPGEAVEYKVSKAKDGYKLALKPKYGAHVRLDLAPSGKKASLTEIALGMQPVAEVAAGEIDRRYLDTTLPIESRIEILLAQMTPQEKMELIREGWGIPGVKRLGIPDIKKVEAIHGYSYGTGATMFPQCIAMAATFNEPLVRKVAGAIGDETKAAGSIQAWSPVLDVARDPRWGRCEESFGEDPYMVSMIGGAWVDGFQSRGLMTTSKHFGAHGAPLGGRDSHDVGFSEREMREVHLVPFRHVFRNYKPESVMMAYSDFMGVPVAASEELLKGYLRDEWGFDGFIVSDCGALGNLTSRKHYTAKDFIEAANLSLRAGIATNCGNTYNNPDVIKAAVDGKLDMEALDDVCRDMLRVMFRQGLFENNPCRPLNWDAPYPEWNTPEHKALARRTAQESIVLLKNADNLLPLGNNIKSIAVLGPGADNPQLGDYSGKTVDGQVHSILEGIREAAPKGCKVNYEKGVDFTASDYNNIAEAVKMAQRSDVAVIVVGDCSGSHSAPGTKHTSGENNDYATLELPGEQQALVDAVCATGTPVLLVLQSGRPFVLTKADAECQAILAAWLPGQEGGFAVADVIFGKYNPAGRLPMTFPRHVGQLPLTYDFKTSGRRYEYSDMEFYPLYRFGYGLSYTTFKYSDIKSEIDDKGNVIVSATVTNTGDRAGDEVAQLYVTDMYSSVKTPVMMLRGFERVSLEPGQSKTVGFVLSPFDLSLLDKDLSRVVEPGEFKLSIGGKSPDFVAKDKIKDSVSFKDGEGVQTTIDYPMAFASDFNMTVDRIETDLATGKRKAVVTVTNNGNIVDVDKVRLYVDGRATGKIRHYELEPAQSRTIEFALPDNEIKDITLTSKHNTVSRSVN